MSEDDYGTSDDESRSEKDKGTQSSKFSHSRFSSQIEGEIEGLGIGFEEGIDINDKEIKVDKNLINDNRNLMKKDNPTNKPVIKKFTDKIGSIQKGVTTDQSPIATESP